MQNEISLTDRIKSAYAALRPSEQKVADFILSHMDEAGNITISQLADRTKVSQPTIMRFVHALGFKGYRNFKYCLVRDGRPDAQESKPFDHLWGFDLKPWDCLPDLPLKEIRVSGKLLEETLKALSPAKLERASHMLAAARTIDIYGVENSCTPANDLLTKLTYLGLNARMHTDAYLQQISAAHLGSPDTAVAFSHSGCSCDTVKALMQAKKAGAGTIAVTSRKNPRLAQYADILLCTGGADLTIYGAAVFSRIPDLAAVDLLYMGIILSDYERFSRSLDKSGAVIAGRGYTNKP
ncbi:MAG: MurR/RpiR family transcriptional regulator [Eubacteriales bacterium]|nr:MurR/RpiR family transcriptional regulator [Eubacteriales bacterium]